MKVWELAEFTPAARRTSARRILELWQQAGRDDGAKPYLRALDRLAVATRDEGKAIDAGDLPNE